MAASKLDITIEQGADFLLSMIWKSGSPAEPVDLTGYSARMQIRVTHASKDALVTLDSNGNGIALGGDAGTIEVAMPAEQTAELPTIIAVYDLELVAPSGAVRRFIEGKATISAEVTRE